MNNDPSNGKPAPASMPLRHIAKEGLGGQRYRRRPALHRAADPYLEPRERSSPHSNPSEIYINYNIMQTYNMYSEPQRKSIYLSAYLPIYLSFHLSWEDIRPKFDWGFRVCFGSVLRFFQDWFELKIYLEFVHVFLRVMCIGLIGLVGYSGLLNSILGSCRLGLLLVKGLSLRFKTS